MPAPRPIDPLDDPISRFCTAVNAFLAMSVDVDPPVKISGSQNPFEHIQRNWEEFKRHIQRSREALIGVQDERLERLEAILSVANEIKALTGDPYIVSPVDGVAMRATDERAEFGNIIPAMSSATSVPTVLALIGELLGFGTRTIARRQEIAKLLNDLTAYYLMKSPPRDSA